MVPFNMPLFCFVHNPLCTDASLSSASSSCSAASDDTIILNFTLCDPPPPEEAAVAEGSQPKRLKGINYEAKEVGSGHCKV